MKKFIRLMLVLVLAVMPALISGCWRGGGIGDGGGLLGAGILGAGSGGGGFSGGAIGSSAAPSGGG